MASIHIPIFIVYNFAMYSITLCNKKRKALETVTFGLVHLLSVHIFTSCFFF